MSPEGIVVSLVGMLVAIIAWFAKRTVDSMARDVKDVATAMVDLGERVSRMEGVLSATGWKAIIPQGGPRVP